LFLTYNAAISRLYDKITNIITVGGCPIVACARPKKCRKIVDNGIVLIFPLLGEAGPAFTNFALAILSDVD